MMVIVAIAAAAAVATTKKSQYYYHHNCCLGLTFLIGICIVFKSVTIATAIDPRIPATTTTSTATAISSLPSSSLLSTATKRAATINEDQLTAELNTTQLDHQYNHEDQQQQQQRQQYDYDDDGNAIDIISTKHIEEACVQNCPDQNRTNSERIDCDRDCYIFQCNIGCTLWESALDGSCKQVCTKDDQEESKELYCIMGCNNALNRYFNWLIDEVGTLSAPALVADSLTATSLSLEWEIPKALRKFTKSKKQITQSYMVQFRFEEDVGDWKVCRNQSMGNNSTVRVDNLQPYTKYRFRVALVLSSNQVKEIYSDQSVIISTLPMGPPSSEPAIVRAVAVDHSRISVSWEPGPFPNGLILSYVLQIKDISSTEGYFAVKDIKAPETFYIIDKLEASTKYEVSVRMTNAEGEGPAALTQVETPSMPENTGDEQKFTILIVADKKIYSQGTNMLVEQAQPIFSSPTRITGFTLHIAKKLIFVSDEAQNVYKAPLNIPNGKKEIILRPESKGIFVPLDLSMDWLNDYLYILFEVRQTKHLWWQISRCKLDGSDCVVVLGGLRSKPSYFEVDPYNGYLFWVIDNSSENGLYRLDLRDVNNGAKHEAKSYLVLEKSNIGAFALDFTHFKIFVPLQNLNIVISMDLDGKKPEEIRNTKNTQTLLFSHVKSIALANQIFYWTDGNSLINEEFHNIERKYYNNNFSFGLPSFSFIRINMSSTQPIPVPVNPPSNLQALLSVTTGKISWHIPHLLGIQGRGAWQEWNYELEITNEDCENKTTHTFRGIRGTHHPVNKLLPNTNYRFRAAAYTSAGHGPWSLEFRARTLKTPHERYLIWSSSNEGLLQSDVLGEHVQELIPKYKIGNHNITDIAWYEDILYFVTNDTLHYYNRTSGLNGPLEGLHSVQLKSIAVDWIGERLYWLNRNKQVIYRSRLSGYDHEALVIPVATQDIDMKIDSIMGYLYFSTGLTVEYCRLDGKQKNEYYREKNYSGKHVMGLTLDMDNHRIYWIVRSFGASTLISAPMAGYGLNTTNILEYELKEKTLQGPVNYLSDRLLWLQDEKTIIIGNLTGKNLAHIRNSKFIGLKSFTVIDSTLHMNPLNMTNKPNVIPESINVTSIQVTGTSKSFNISWSPIKSVTYGDVFYDIRFLTITTETNYPSVQYTNQSLKPYSQMDISIQAYTYWAKSDLIKITLRTPAAPSSAPQNPRVFINHYYGPLMDTVNIEATFRWSLPQNPNGPILGYTIICWRQQSTDGTNKIIDIQQYNLMDANNFLEMKISNLISNKIYYFQVNAYSLAGNGSLSEPISINSDTINPVPRLIAANSEEILRVDLDFNRTDLIVKTGSVVRLMTYLNYEKTYFWINENNELFSYRRYQLKQKLATLNSKALSLTVDWVRRILYWSELNGTPSDGTSVFYLDLNSINNNNNNNNNQLSQPQVLFNRSGCVWNLVVSGFDQTLFWIETTSLTNDYGIVYRYSLKGKKESVPYFGVKKIVKKKTLLLDTDGNIADINRLIIWSPENSGTIGNSNQLLSIDVHRRLSNYTIQLSSFESSVKALVKDNGHFYWIQNETIYVMSSSTGYLLQSLHIPQVQILLSYFSQLYPHKNCLMPIQHYGYTPTLNISKDRSIVLNLPEPHLADDCPKRTPPLAGVKYSILYKKLELYELKLDTAEPCNRNTCNLITSYLPIKEISGLLPFESYKFQLAVNNYYGEMIDNSSYFGPLVVFSTSIGTPTIPRNVTAEVISPNEAIIRWYSPEELNAEFVWFEVHWQTQYDINGVKNQQFLSEPKKYNRFNNKEPISVVITKLLPNQLYSISVKASTSNVTFSQSKSIFILTIPEPEDLTTTEITPTNLCVKWRTHPNITNYLIKYEELNSLQDFKETFILYSNMSEQLNDIALFNVTNLKPKTRYQFLISLYFFQREIPYIWPQDKRFIFETLGDRPSTPGKPIIKHVQDSVYKVSWESSLDNGAQINEYHLEAMIKSQSVVHVKRAAVDYNLATIKNYSSSVEHDDSSQNFIINDVENKLIEGKWYICYNGTDTYWIIQKNITISDTSFRVRSRNSNGWSNYSPISDPIDELNASTTRRSYLLMTFVPAVLIIFLILIVFIIYIFRRKIEDKQHFQEPITRLPDVELANLRDLPRTGNLIHSNNILYSFGQISDADIALLPQIQREKIVMTKFLGSGQFGDVYEGIVKNAMHEHQNQNHQLVQETKVAIKTLKKGATEQDKSEFLQEAQLMSNFKHEHILRLIGICFYMDELYIIMELMEGGDLQVFLRQSRPTVGNPSTLYLYDLISMCVDIASGCRYLEEMHFVHRDLACRNCLVSSVEPMNRVVKIGDFGLARDIYKNDYYRKDGEGLLPVRWMSPESLVDGVFTSQSDIWAFGVLCWEIMTLGHQPYPARGNLEVLQYVRHGGRLSRPAGCPEKLYDLMLKCWSYRPEERPTFRYCLDVLLDLKECTGDAIQISSNDLNRLQPCNGMFNRSYLLPDVNHNNNIRDSLKFNSNEPPILVTPTSSAAASPMLPKYLELIYDEQMDHQSMLINDVGDTICGHDDDDDDDDDHDGGDGSGGGDCDGGFIDGIDIGGGGGNGSGDIRGGSSIGNDYEIPLHKQNRSNSQNSNSCISCDESNSNSLSSNQRHSFLHHHNNNYQHHSQQQQQQLQQQKHQLQPSQCYPISIGTKLGHSNIEKERTFSSSSTASGISVCEKNNNNNNNNNNKNNNNNNNNKNNNNKQFLRVNLCNSIDEGIIGDLGGGGSSSGSGCSDGGSGIEVSKPFYTNSAVASSAVSGVIIDDVNMNNKRLKFN